MCFSQSLRWSACKDATPPNKQLPSRSEVTAVFRSMVMLPPPGLAIASPANRFSSPPPLQDAKKWPIVVFCRFSYKRLVLCSIADLLECADNRNQAVKGVKFLHFSHSLTCSIRFSFLLYMVKGFFDVSGVLLPPFIGLGCVAQSI